MKRVTEVIPKVKIFNFHISLIIERMVLKRHGMIPDGLLHDRITLDFSISGQVTEK